MEKKKEFAEPVCEVTRFAVEDIIATSREGWETDFIGGIQEISKVN